ncbi:cAMP-dependent protein kinase catalytic subunit alpha-like isoform X2 [Diorhabda carinulata]|uniref:cAMP-dependent protein kinase catalytic subunit alpha-like isoform X2 n=1 Tax=Diorhabda carinulata TaxID=1163345 RepID=UPI0025A2A394|nr:cAMP-dependent protein kinase catalytic subunit alpha-like isoform X2 [Diorhabda carinulata]
MIFFKDFYRKGKNKSTYNEILEKLKEEFYVNWEKKISSDSVGLENYTRIKTLGTGSFGHVYLVHKNGGDKDAFFAMKCISKVKIMKLKQLEHTQFEKKMLSSINFPFIVHMHACYKDNSYVYFVMPFINGGEMFTHLRRMRRFSETLSRFYAAQVLLALEYLHYCDIVYRDLKPENILIDNKGYLKIADLGFCKIVKGRTWTLCGTPEYIAPEIILSKGYSKAVDWWSFGVLLFEMNAGYAPFASADVMKIYEKIIICKYKCPGTFTNDLQHLVQNVLQLDLSRRYGNLKNGTQDLKNHRWFKDTDFMALYNRQVEPPFKPALKSISDTSNFDNYDEEPLKISENNQFKEEFENF